MFYQNSDPSRCDGAVLDRHLADVRNPCFYAIKNHYQVLQQDFEPCRPNSL
jgi:hypothetical protein